MNRNNDQRTETEQMTGTEQTVGLEQTGNTVVVIGAGPVGLAAAVHLLNRGLNPVILERGPSAGHAMAEWGHVRVFTPWKYVTDQAVVAQLEQAGWTHPAGDHLPTGGEIVAEYLIPAAALPQLRDRIRFNAEVTAVSKHGLSKSSSARRGDVPFTVHYTGPDGRGAVMRAGAVIDASGTWFSPNPIGADGLPVPGEREFARHISYGLPNVWGDDRQAYEGKTTLVLGGGHSAINVVLDILQLKESAEDTRLVWGLRQNRIEKLLGGGINDELPARGALGLAAKQAIDDGVLDLLAPVQVQRISAASPDHPGNAALAVDITVDGQDRTIHVDRVVVAAGFRPNLDMLRELRLDLDQVVEAPRILAPMIDPNLHSCGTVRPHGVDELSHPDENFFITGMKAYGRAPTFLMKTGYEQVRSIADELAGNHQAARRIELDLPETGVCNSRPQSSVPGAAIAPAADTGCCGGGAETGTDATTSTNASAPAGAGCCG